jgi:charged multivesicular body protein 6
VEGIIKRELELAKAAAAEGHKDKALLILKKKKYQEDLLAKTDGQIMNLEQMASSIEFALVETKVIEGIRQGNSILKQINAEMSIEDVEKLMEETAEGIAYQNKVSELLAGEYTSAEDEAHLMEELAELQELEAMPAKQLLRETLPSVPTVSPTPAAPTEVPVEKEHEEEEQELASPMLSI